MRLQETTQVDTNTTLTTHIQPIRNICLDAVFVEENLTFSQISDALSFENPQYFSRVFKRVTGMTPTEFKVSLHFKE